MSLKHALLGFINYGPMTGYEVKKFFDTSVAHFWNAELSQIYPALKGMETEGLVEMKVEHQQDRPNRKVYSITEEGRQELLNWLAEPAELEQVREPILIKIFFGSAIGKQQLLDVLRASAEDSRGILEYMEKGRPLAQGFLQAIGLKSEAVFCMLTMDAGIRAHKAELEWAEEAIATIEAMDDSAFECSHDDVEVDIRTATEILDRFKAAMPGALADPRGYHVSKAAARRKQPEEVSA